MNNETCSCGRPVVKGKGFDVPVCIFHLLGIPLENAPKVFKDYLTKEYKSDFIRAFRDYINGTYEKYENTAEGEKEKIVLDCKGFVFPFLNAANLGKLKDNKSEPAAPIIIPFKIDFTKAVFYVEVLLNGVTFEKRIIFRDAKFGTISKSLPVEEESYTRRRTLNVSADFTKVKFLGGVDFNGSKFFCQASFNNTRFKQKADFTQTEFHDDADFSLAVFYCPLNIIDSYFGRETDFGVAVFLKKANFSEAHFVEKAGFQQAEFRAKADFNRVTVEGPFDMSHVGQVIKRKPEAYPLPFYKNGIVKILKPEALIELTFADFKKGAKVLLRGTCIKKWSFLGTVATKDADIFEFDEAIWKLASEKRKILYDEKQINGKLITYGRVAESYRRLRLNYESRLAYETASDFHIGQMEMLLLSLKPKNPKKWFLWLYKYISNFGESTGRPLLWLLGSLAVFFAFWCIEPFLPDLLEFINIFKMDLSAITVLLAKTEIAPPEVTISYFIRKFIRTWIAFFPFTKLTTYGLRSFVEVTQKVTGGILAAFLTLALRRAFRR